jgi:hypothetical protein
MASYAASLSVLLVSALSLLGFASWVSLVPDLTWRGLLALMSGVFGVALSALLWLRPSRAIAGATLGLLLVSLVRLRGPEHWEVGTLVFVVLSIAAAATTSAVMIRST